MFSPIRNLTKLDLKKCSVLRSVFYFFAREKPESALIQLILSLTSVDIDKA